MALPEGFKESKHLQNTVRLQVNGILKEFFKDLGDTWEPNVNTNRDKLYKACRHETGDSMVMTNVRLRLLYDVLGYGKADLMVYHGGMDEIANAVEGHPKVTLYFSQDKAAVPDGEAPVTMECSFRLMNETQSTFTKANAISLANKIKSQFVVNRQGVLFTKGKKIYYYKDKPAGYELRLYGNTESDAVDIIRRALECQDKVYDADKLSISEPKKSNTASQGTHLVYGKTVKKPKYRPSANVRFRYAYVEIPGLVKNIFLVDTTYRHIPLVDA